MQIRKAVGRAGATHKYDLLTVLGVYALSQDRRLQRQTLRLICLITARYNWQHDHLSVGQGEIARLWSVDTRTVKREMAAFRDRGWLVERRAAARGRVTLYGLGIARILADTREVWERVGPDLAGRLDGPGEDGPAAEASNVIPFPPAAAEGSLWAEVGRLLQAEDASVFRAWFAMLTVEGEGGALILRAPSSFHARYIQTHLEGRIESALQRLAPGLRWEIRG